MGQIVDKRIVVTGGAGFVGSYVCEELRRAGVGDVSIPRSATYDLTQQDAVHQLFADTTPDIVVHIASEIGGLAAHQTNPGRFFYANMAMGLHMIEEARRRRVEKFVQVGTVCVYPKFAPVPFREDDLWNGYPDEANAPYGVAKKSLLTMLQAYRQQYNLNGIFLIPANMYGPRSNFDPNTSHVVAALIRKFVTARDAGHPEVVAWGTGSASREFLYVEDGARAIVLATDKYNGDQPVNIGTGKGITIRELVELVAQLTGYEGKVIWDTTKPDGQPRRKFDTSRAAQLFGFEATTELEDGLRKTIEWFESRQ